MQPLASRPEGVGHAEAGAAGVRAAKVRHVVLISREESRKRTRSDPRPTQVHEASVVLVLGGVVATAQSEEEVHQTSVWRDDFKSRSQERATWRLTNAWYLTVPFRWI